MDVLVTCKYEEDPIKNEGARVDTTLYSNFSVAQGQITLECSQDFSHYKSMGIFPDAQGQLTLQSTVQSGQISNSVKTL